MFLKCERFWENEILPFSTLKEQKSVVIMMQNEIILPAHLKEQKCILSIYLRWDFNQPWEAEASTIWFCSWVASNIENVIKIMRTELNLMTEILMARSPTETTDGKLFFKHQRAQKLDNSPDTFNCWCHNPHVFFDHSIMKFLFTFRKIRKTNFHPTIMEPRFRSASIQLKFNVQAHWRYM